MGINVLLLNQDSEAIQPLVNYFIEWEDNVIPASTEAEARDFLEKFEPELVIIDLHLPNSNLDNLLPYIQKKCPNGKILITTNYPDPEQESRLKTNHSARVFLRQPFTRTAIENALRDLEGTRPVEGSQQQDANLPKVRVPVRLKITFPYVILALLLALASAYVVSQIVLDTVLERFTNQLIEAGKLSNDWMVNEENRLLETLRLVSFTRDLPEFVAATDTESLRKIVLPLAVNNQTEAIEILDTQGTSILSMRHIPGGNLEDYEFTRGETMLGQWDFVSAVLNQQTDQIHNKTAGLSQTPWGNYLYVAGPISGENDEFLGVVLVGKSLETLVRQIRQDTLAHSTIYDLNGQPVASTLLLSDQSAITVSPESVDNILSRQDSGSVSRSVSAASVDYTEILGPWQVREVINPATQSRANNDIGLIGAALADTFLARPSQFTRAQIFILTAAAFIAVILLGIIMANRITNPLLRVVHASSQVAQGNLDVEVDAKGDDEVAVLAHSFNHMIYGLREGSMYRDLFGRTVSPEVREELRQGFASGDVRLEGQDAVAAVLMSDIRDFTKLSETVSPTTILNWLNEYFDEVVPVITSNGGVISKFEGDAVLAFFGILPRPISPDESAFRACKTALAMLEAIERLNVRRELRGDPPFGAGIGINIGPVTAGGLGSADRLHYTIIGDTVNTTARLESLTREISSVNSIVVSQHTLFALKDKRHHFTFIAQGVHSFKGKEEQLLVYELKAADTTEPVLKEPA